MSSCVLHIQVTASPPQPWLAALHLKSMAAASTICESGWSNDVSQDVHRLLDEALFNATMVSGHNPDPRKTSPTWPHMKMCRRATNPWGHACRRAPARVAAADTLLNVQLEGLPECDQDFFLVINEVDWRARRPAPPQAASIFFGEVEEGQCAAAETARLETSLEVRQCS